MRVTDTRWRMLLTNLRRGQMQEEDIITLRRLIIGKSSSKHDNYDHEPWANASLVTPRHGVRTLWNEALSRKWCRKNNQQLFICTAEDTISKRPLTLRERYHLALRLKNERRQQRKDLPTKITIAKGMKVLVTDNVETDLDITNGARGEIVDIILHPDEPPIGDEPIIKLEFLPLYILVKLDRTRASKLDKLEEGVIPIQYAQTTMEIKIPNGEGKTVRRTVKRKQFPMTAAYAFTDYRSQGQTLSYVIVDIATPPSGTLSLFNLYVALSRSSGRETIRLLRDFDDELFKKSHDVFLLEEDDRLERLNESTRSWWLALNVL
jgi:hypothetical protein